MANWLGNARVVNSGGLLGATRVWRLLTENTDVNDDIHNWEYTAGSKVTVYYRTGTTGLTPPDSADTIILEVRRSDGTVLKQLHNGAPPANGSSFTFYMTDNGDLGGSDRCGGLELYVRAIRSGGLSPYDLNSQSGGDRGIIRSNAKVSNIEVNSYPAGDKFAYGASASENILSTITHTQPFVSNEGQCQISILDGSDTQSTLAPQGLSGTSTVGQFTVNQQFDSQLKSYGVKIDATSNLFLSPTSGNVLWTRFIPSGPNVEFHPLSAAHDGSGNGRFLRIIGNPTLVSSPWGGFNNALSLDGVDNNKDTQRAVSYHSYDVSTGSFVIESKFRADDVTSTQVVFASGQRRHTDVIFNGVCAFISSGLIRIGSYEDGTTVTATGSTTIVVGQSYDLAIVWNGSQIELLLDGVTEVTLSRAVAFGTEHKISIGGFHHNDGSYAFNGIIDDVRLSLNTTRNYPGGYTPSSTPLTSDAQTWGLWQFDNSALNPTAVSRPPFFNVDPRITLGAPTIGHTVYNRGELATIDVGVTNARGESLTRSLNYQIKDSLGNVKKASSDTGPNYDFDYTIGSSDDASFDLVGKQWTFNINQADVENNPSANAYSVSSFYYVDLHTQLSGALNKDDFPNDDDNEDFSFVILGDVVNAWVHVEGVRNDGTEIDTSGSSITITIKDPDDGIVNTFNVDTGADGWTPKLTLNPSAPAGDWTYNANVTFNGNSGSDSETITYITPLTSNLTTLIKSPVIMLTGQSTRVHFRVEEDDIDGSPQTVPVYRIMKVDENDSWVEEISESTMLNVVDDTATINGPDYYFDFTAPTTPGRYVIWTKVQLNGNGIRSSSPLYVVREIIDGSGFIGFPTKLDL